MRPAARLRLPFFLIVSPISRSGSLAPPHSQQFCSGSSTPPPDPSFCANATGLEEIHTLTKSESGRVNSSLSAVPKTVNYCAQVEKHELLKGARRRWSLTTKKISPEPTRLEQLVWCTKTQNVGHTRLSDGSPAFLRLSGLVAKICLNSSHRRKFAFSFADTRSDGPQKALQQIGEGQASLPPHIGENSALNQRTLQRPGPHRTRDVIGVRVMVGRPLSERCQLETAEDKRCLNAVTMFTRNRVSKTQNERSKQKTQMRRNV